MNHYSLQLNLKPFMKSRQLFWIFSWTIVFLILGYGYLIHSAVRNVTHREQAEIKLANLRSTLGDLESNYMELKKKITIELAGTLGFREVKESTFIARPAFGTTLPRSNEI